MAIFRDDTTHQAVVGKSMCMHNLKSVEGLRQDLDAGARIFLDLRSGARFIR